MAVFNEPQKWGQTLGQDADVVLIPDTAGDTEPSIDKIFPSVFSIPLAKGGKAIPRSVLNGLFKLIGDWIYYIQNGGIASYSASFDYAVGSFVKYNDEFYSCIQVNGASTEIKAPTETAYWSKISTLADISSTFANQDLSNLSASGQAIIDNKTDISFSNVNNTANILMAHNAMPSNVYDELTWGANGTQYTAPADGFFRAGYYSAESKQIGLNNTNSRLAINFFSNGSKNIWIPAKKGDSIALTYDATSYSNTYIIFIYAVGSESEQ